MATGSTKTCLKCGRTLDESAQFYSLKDGSKTDLCKKCLTMHIDNFEPDTFLWILEEMDVPYVKEEWDVLRDRAFAKNPNLNGMSVFGKYLSKMKLKQWREYTWADTERLKKLNEEKKLAREEELARYERDLQRQYEEGEISENEYKTCMTTETQNENYANNFPSTPMPPEAFPETQYMKEEELIDLGADLTQDDKIYLAMKWGRLYKPSEWVELEKKYKEMTESFDIQDADTINTLVLICKTNLKMNQYLDEGDIEGFQKLSRVSESLRKSAKFTAAQNKEQKEDFVDCVGNIVSYCEKNGGQIPKYEIDAKPDIVDKIIKDLKEYTRSLIYEDTALAQQIETYIKKRDAAEQHKKDIKDAKEKGLDAVEITDQDIIDHKEHLRELAEADEKEEAKG